MKVLIAPDKFKGTLTAMEAASAIASGWASSRPQDQLLCLPIADGGDGFGPALGEQLNAERRISSTVDAALRPVNAPWWYDSKTRTAIIDTAAIIGLAMLPAGQYHPFDLNTSGIAKVLFESTTLGAKKILMGIGGSATNDGGFGMARALGWRFLDASGNAINAWHNLTELQRLEAPTDFNLPRIEVAVDVQNRLLGDEGATRIYGPQKGLSTNDFPRAEACLSSLSSVHHETTGLSIASQPGTGAAGGLGFGLMAFTEARLKPGFKLVADAVDLWPALNNAALVITGEGKLDGSSLMGKGVGELLRESMARKIPVICLGGTRSSDFDVMTNKLRPRMIKSIHPDLADSTAARSNAQRLLVDLGRIAGEEWEDEHE